jgi:hypothetical protein
MKFLLFVISMVSSTVIREPLVALPTIHNLTQNSGGWLQLPLPNATGELALSVLDSVGEINMSFCPSFLIGPGSPFAARVGSMMLVPPSESYPSFRMIESIRDPTSFCFDGTIGLAEMGPSDRAVTFSASVALIPQGGGRPLTGLSPNSRLEFQLNTADYEDQIPRGFLSHMACSMDASIEYTIYRSAESSEVVARIVIGMRDYVWSNTLALTGGDGPYQLGVNTLKYVGVYLNYATRQIGFCEPIEYTPTPVIDY